MDEKVNSAVIGSSDPDWEAIVHQLLHQATEAMKTIWQYLVDVAQAMWAFVVTGTSETNWNEIAHQFLLQAAEVVQTIWHWLVHVACVVWQFVVKISGYILEGLEYCSHDLWEIFLRIPQLIALGLAAVAAVGVALIVVAAMVIAFSEIVERMGPAHNDVESARLLSGRQWPAPYTYAPREITRSRSPLTRPAPVPAQFPRSSKAPTPPSAYNAM